MSKFTPAQLKEMADNTIKKGAVQFIIKKILDLLTPKTNSYHRLTVYKHPNNHDMDVIEEEDIVVGYRPDGVFVTAKFLGGNSADWENFQILSDLIK